MIVSLNERFVRVFDKLSDAKFKINVAYVLRLKLFKDLQPVLNPDLALTF